MLTYANILARILQFLQDTGAATFDATETGYAIENELKRLSRYSPLMIDTIYHVESRTGTDTAGTASKLTDTTKSQFLAADATNEKVIHNTTDDTWTVVTGHTSTSVLSISKDIMDSGEEYEIYNKRCKNIRQIYIGDMAPYLWVESVEYPIGTERNFTVNDNILELDVNDATIEDSNSTLSVLNEVDVLVRFAIPQVLSQLTDWGGALTADATADAITIAIDGMGTTDTIEVGEVFTLENHRTTYVVTTAVTMVAEAGNLIFYPPLEAAASNNDAVTFRASSLQPVHEDLLERMVDSRLVQSNMITYIGANANAISKGGSGSFRNFQSFINNNPLLSPLLIQRELETLAKPRVARVCSKL